MAKLIKPTPILSSANAEKFLRKVEANLKEPSYRVDTPKLGHAKKLAMSHAIVQPK